MKAAIVETFGTPPHYGDFEEPQAAAGEMVVTVHAAPLSPIVKAIAAGQHYTSAQSARFVPGVDGVGTDASGKRVYFLFPKAPFGSFAQQALVASDMVAAIPDALADDAAAAIVAGGLASWVALSRRARPQKGDTVLVNGATGAAGAMAIQAARYFGAGKVIAVGRNRRKLEGLDADARVTLDDPEELDRQFAQGVNVVLDFLWGEPAARVLRAASQPRGSRAGEPRLRFVQLGTIAGDVIPIRGDLLRSTGIELIGSGVGSVGVKDLSNAAGELLAAAPAAGFHAPFTVAPLSNVAEVWNTEPEARLLLRP